MGISGNVFRIFLFFSSVLYEWFIALPEPIKWSGAVVFLIVLGGMAFAIRRQFPLHLDGFRNKLGQFYSSLWTFLMGGVVLKVVYPLTVSVLPFYGYPGFWIVIVWEASLLAWVYLLRKPEWVFGIGRWMVRCLERGFLGLQAKLAR